MRSLIIVGIKIISNKISKKRQRIVAFITEEMMEFCSLPRRWYSTKKGINVVLSAPFIRISNTRSGILKAAKYISSSSLVKKPASMRYRINPAILERRIIPERISVEVIMFDWNEKMAFVVLEIN